MQEPLVKTTSPVVHNAEQLEAHFEALVKMGVLGKFADPTTGEIRYIALVEEMA